MEIRAGTSGYAYREWKGKFYPEKISSRDMLRFYSQRLSTVEINNTFYRMPTEELLSSWAKQVSHDFLFVIKAPQTITHLKRLRNAGGETEHLFRVLQVLGNNLGPVLFQFPGSFRVDAEPLRGFLDAIPGSVSCAFEFRSRIDAGVLDLLREKGHALCIADTDENPAVEVRRTSSWGYLRLRRSAYTDADLREWKERMLGQKWERAFVFFKHEDEARGAETALRFQALVSAEAGQKPDALATASE